MHNPASCRRYLILYGLQAVPLMYKTIKGAFVDTRQCFALQCQPCDSANSTTQEAKEAGHSQAAWMQLSAQQAMLSWQTVPVGWPRCSVAFSFFAWRGPAGVRARAETTMTHGYLVAAKREQRCTTISYVSWVSSKAVSRYHCFLD